jgi:NAD+-dependent secondary alcohol dehydrogenase Adh1
VKAARLHRYREPFTLEEVQEPGLSGPYDVVVRVAAVGLCRTDIHIIDGMLEPFGVRLPYTPGHENGSVWVTNTTDSTLSRIDAGSGRVVATIPLGSTPAGLAAGDGGGLGDGRGHRGARAREPSH